MRIFKKIVVWLFGLARDEASTQAALWIYAKAAAAGLVTTGAVIAIGGAALSPPEGLPPDRRATRGTRAKSRRARRRPQGRRPKI